jgi:alkyldihydroxyacetonephosphate synthase
VDGDRLESLIERLPSGTVSTHHGELATHARDRWALALLQEVRGDRVAPGVALVFPKSTAEVAIVLEWAGETGTPVVPRGGGTGLSGGAQAVVRGVVLDLSRMNRVLAIDDVSQTVEVQAGARGGDLEAEVRRRGLTLGHDPVSIHMATVGGWVAAATAGMTVPGHGRAGDRVVGLTAVLADGTVVRTAGVGGGGGAPGPDLRRVIAGSEGTLAVVTEATLALARAPKDVVWDSFRPGSFEAGLSLAREITQQPFRPLVVRLLDAAEAAWQFSAFGLGDTPMLFVGFDAGAPAVEAERFELRRMAKELGARGLGNELAEHWWDHRHDGFEWYEGVMGPERTEGSGVVVDQFDVGAVWRRLPRLYEDLRGILLDHAETVGCLLDDPGETGGSLLLRFTIRAPDDREAERRYRAAWGEAGAAALAAGGVLGPVHGAGLLKAGFMPTQLGDGATELLRRMKAALDPAGILNPGKLLGPPPPPPPA